MRARALAAAAILLLTAGVVACAADTPAVDGSSSESESESESEPESLAARAAHSMTPLDTGALLVAGGCVVDGCATATTSSFLVRGDAAEPTADLNDARDAHTATLLSDGRVLVTGGFAAEGTGPLTSAEIFDPDTGRWTQVGDLGVGRGGHSAALLGDGRVLVAGGWVGPRQYTATTEIFDPQSGEFTAGPTLPEAVLAPGAVALADGCVLLAGGQLDSSTASDTALTVCPGGALTPVGTLGQPRFKHATVLLSSGEVLVVGGTPDDLELLATSEVFDPATGRFHPGPDLLEGRYKMGAVVLPDGRVAVSGGGPGIEILDVVGGASDHVDAAGDVVASFSTIGVSDGRLIVLGGYDESIQLTGLHLSVPLTEL